MNKPSTMLPNLLPMAGAPTTMPKATLRLLRVGACAALLLLLAGCALLGSGRSGHASTIYAPDPRVPADPSWPTVDWQLSLSNTTAPRMIDSLRIAVRPTPNELQVYKNASWAKMPSNMLEDALLRALEDSGRIRAVARQGSGIGADYKLVLDLRRFESVYRAGDALPAATIEVNAKLLHARDQQVVATRTFLQVQPASSAAVPAVVDAFEQSLAMVSADLAGWLLVSGDAHERGAHR
jgi:cholesterol transport system auxiliary component